MLCGCRTVVFENGTRRAHSVSEHRRHVDDEVGLRFVRASVAVLRKSSSVWHDMAVSHRRAHRQRCTRQANQRGAADGCPTCADDDKLGNDDYVMTCDITQMITDNKITFVKHFRCLWSLGFHTVRRSQQASASGATHKLAHRHDIYAVCNLRSCVALSCRSRVSALVPCSRGSYRSPVAHKSRSNTDRGTSIPRGGAAGPTASRHGLRI